MKVVKFKVLLYLKKSGLDKSGKAPIMGRITVNRTMAQFGCKLSCTPELWNPRESRLNGKSKEAVETNAKIEKLLLAVNNAFDSLVSRKVDFDATDVKNHFQGNMETQMTLMRMTDVVCDDLKARIGIDRAKGDLSRLSLYASDTRRVSSSISTRSRILAFRATDGTVHPRLSGIHDGKQGICDRHRPPSSCHPEKDMPSGV